MATNFSYSILTGLQSTVGSIRYWAQHADLAVDQILEEAQRWIFAKLRVREMRFGPDNVSIASGSYTASLPDGFQDPIYLRLDGDSDDLDYVQENLLAREYNEDGTDVTTGKPRRWSIFGATSDNPSGLIQFEVMTDAAYNGRMVYYGTPELIASGTQENFLSTRYPWVFKDALIAFAYKQRKRDAFAGQLQLAAAGIEEINLTDDMGRRGQIMR